MNLKLCIALMAAICIAVSCKTQKSNDAFIEDVTKFYNDKSSISYDIDYRIKYFDEDDTTHLKGNSKIIRDVKDTVFGGRFWYTVNDTAGGDYSKYYNGENFYFINPSKNEITRYKESFIIQGATDGEFINIKFFKPTRLAEFLHDKKNKITIQDTLIKAQKYVSFKVGFPNEDDISNQSITFYIKKETKTIDNIIFYTELKDQVQYNEWKLSNIKFNGVLPETLKYQLAAVSKEYPVKDYAEPTEEQTAPLKNDIPAPVFTAKMYNNDKEISLADYKGKIVLLDFWYMGCGYCTMAVPHLSNIQNKFKDKVVVLGVNPFDKTEKKLKKIPDYIKRNNPEYSLAFIDHSVAQQYNIWGYPTLYIIDEQGVIRHAHTGYNEDYEKDIESIITALLGK